MAFQKRAISLRASRFGWSLLDWRLQRWWKNACDQVAWRTSVAKVRFSGACLWILTAIVSLFSNVSWGIRVGCQRSVGAVKRFFGCVHANTARALGRSHGYVEDIKGASKRIVVMYVVVPLAFIATRPRELWKLHSWRISKIRQDIAAELWFFEEPSAWVELRMPQFNRMLWKPVGKIWRRLVKVWHFVEYQLSKRWRKSQ